MDAIDLLYMILNFLRIFLTKTLLFVYDSGFNVVGLITDKNAKELKNKFNTNVKNLCYDNFWWLLQYYSLIQIEYKTKYVPYFNKVTKNYFLYDIITIKNKDIKKKYRSYGDYIKYDELSKSNDFSIYVQHSNDNKKNYSKIFNERITDFNMEPCEVNFMYMKIHYQDNSYDIDLKKNNNFMILNQTLTDKFFKYYLNVNHGVKIPPLVKNYHISFMDETCIETKLYPNIEITFMKEDNKNIIKYKSGPAPTITHKNKDENIEKFINIMSQQGAKITGKVLDDTIVNLVK